MGAEIARFCNMAWMVQREDDECISQQEETSRMEREAARTAHEAAVSLACLKIV